MHFRHTTLCLAVLALTACDSMPMKIGDSSAKTVVTGAAGGATASNANTQLEHCDASLGTLAIVEDQTSPWFYQLREYKLSSTVPLIRLLVQQSNCFVVVERGRAINNMMQERALEHSGEMRRGSNFGKGQMVSADNSLNPMISFSNGNAGGMSGALASFGGGLGMLGALAGSMKTREASTILTLVDNRSGVQLAAAEGSASKTDFGMWGALFSGSGAGSLGGYTNTAEGKVLAAAFADSFNQMVKSVRNYKTQEVKGGLGKGGNLMVGK